MNNNDCGYNGSGYTFGNDGYDINFGSMYSGNYGSCDCGKDNYGGHKCAFVRDDDCGCKKPEKDCGCGHKYEKDCGCGRYEQDCGCGHKYEDCGHKYEKDCGCDKDWNCRQDSICFRFCIPSFPFRCK